MHRQLTSRLANRLPFHVEEALEKEIEAIPFCHLPSSLKLRLKDTNTCSISSVKDEHTDVSDKWDIYYRILPSFVFVLQSTYTDKVPDSSVLPLEHRGVDINPIPLGAASSANKRQIPLPPNYIPSGPGLLPPPSGGLASYPPQGSPIGPASEDQWPIGQPSDQPQIKNLQVQCEKTHMRVNIEFDRPFYGMIFSKGHYSDSNCVHVRPGSGQLSATFDVYLNSCGMTSSANQVIIHLTIYNQRQLKTNSFI